MIPGNYCYGINKVQLTLTLWQSGQVKWVCLYKMGQNGNCQQKIFLSLLPSKLVSRGKKMWRKRIWSQKSFIVTTK